MEASRRLSGAAERGCSAPLQHGLHYIKQGLESSGAGLSPGAHVILDGCEQEVDGGLPIVEDACIAVFPNYPSDQWDNRSECLAERRGVELVADLHQA